MKKDIQEATYFMNFNEVVVQQFIAQNTTPNKSKEEKATELYLSLIHI